MIIRTRSNREYRDTLAMLRIINDLRERGPGYNPPIMTDTPWIVTRWARPQYL